MLNGWWFTETWFSVRAYVYYNNFLFLSLLLSPVQLLIPVYAAFLCCSCVYLVTVPAIAIPACLEQRFSLASYCCHWSTRLNTLRLARQWFISIAVQMILGTDGKCNSKMYGVKLIFPFFTISVLHFKYLYSFPPSCFFCMVSWIFLNGQMNSCLCIWYQVCSSASIQVLASERNLVENKNILY